MAIDASNEAYRAKFAATQHKISGKKRTYILTLYTRQDTDGKTEYIIRVNGGKVLKTTNIPNKTGYSMPERHATKDVELRPSDIIQVAFHNPPTD